MTGNLHLKDGGGLLVVRGFGIGQERHDASLEGAKSAFDFPFGLRTGGDEVGDPKTFECALELTFGIAFVITGTHSKEAQGVCVDHFGDAVLLKGPPEVQEVIPGGVAGDEGASEIGQRGRTLILDIWSSGGARTNLADGMGVPMCSLASLKHHAEGSSHPAC